MKQPLLPPPSSTFHLRKSKILSQLSLPDEQYIDLSPKGSVDVGIRDLISEINAREGLVTTSSCAGRVSVYLEGCKKPKQSESQEQEKEKEKEKEEQEQEIVNSSSAVGGKGGGEWLFVSHDPVEFQKKYEGLFGLQPQPHPQENEKEKDEDEWENKKEEEPVRLVHFKFEPMILHVLTASREHAQLVIQAGMEAGFRETGAVSLLNNKKGDEEKEGTGPIVAVRSMGLSFESLVGVESSDKNGVVVRRAIVSSSYLRMLVRISHERFEENQKRIARFRGALTAAFEPPVKKDWEDAEARRERKRLEGLKKREEMRRQKETQEDRGPTAGDVLDVVLQQPDVL